MANWKKVKARYYVDSEDIDYDSLGIERPNNWEYNELWINTDEMSAIEEYEGYIMIKDITNNATGYILSLKYSDENILGLVNI